MAALAGTLLAACSAGEADPTATLPPAPTAASANPTRTPESAADQGYTSDPDAILTAVAQQQEPPTSVPTYDIAAAPTFDGVVGSSEVQRFADRLDNALRALSRLPGYTYTVRLGIAQGYAAGLELEGRVTTPDRREWIVYEQDQPEHVIARWVRVDGQNYTDISGVWRRVESIPFDTTAPVSFGDAYESVLFEPIGDATGERRSEAAVSSQDAILYQIDRPLGEYALNPEQEARTTTDYLYVAEDGGYLLGYTSPSVFGAPDSPERAIEVTPLQRAPRINAPRVGAAVFEGVPPPWRALAVGRARLESLPGYRFSSRTATYGLTIQTEGQVSPEKGWVEGVVPDAASLADQANSGEPFDAAEIEMARLELVYSGRRTWVRGQDGAWRSASTNIVDGPAPDENALELLSHIPGGPPETVVGSRADFDSYYYPPLFGIHGLKGALILVGDTVRSRETINGVQTFHYRGSVNSRGENALFGVDVWLAADGLYPVRLRVNFASPPDAPPESVEGSTFDVYDALEPFTVAVPDP